VFGRGTLIVPKYLLVFERTERETRDIQSPGYIYTNFTKYGKISVYSELCNLPKPRRLLYVSPGLTLKKFYVLPTQCTCIYVFCMDLRKKKQRLFPYTALTDWFLFLGEFAKLREASISFAISVRLSAWEQLGSHWMDFHEISYLIIFRKSVQKIPISLQSDTNNEALFIEANIRF